MRYSSPEEPYGPRTLVGDAIFLKANLNIEGGSQLIAKYSGRLPPQFKQIEHRPSTPDSVAGSATPNSFRARSPLSGSPAPRAFDSLLQDAARGVLSRGEKWGFNLRDTVGQVQKNIQGIQSGLASPRLTPVHRASRSEVSNNIAANVLRKMTALEDRNKALAKMLESAVADLWKLEKRASENKEPEDESVQMLSTAVARVQFVQVFLQDSTLPLPPGEGAEATSAETKAKDEPVLAIEESKEPTPKPPAGEPAAIEAVPSTSSPKQPILSRSPPKPAIQLEHSPIPPATRATMERASLPGLPTTSLSSEHASGTPSTSLSIPEQNQIRPKLEQSSFSWMLGQAHEHRKSFINPLPFSPAEKRHHEQKGFLFGEEDDIVGEAPKIVDKKAKGKDKKKGSVSKAREDIGLGDLGSASEIDESTT
jgi:TBC1 domain family protein 5